MNYYAVSCWSNNLNEKVNILRIKIVQDRQTQDYTQLINQFFDANAGMSKTLYDLHLNEEL